MRRISLLSLALTMFGGLAAAGTAAQAATCIGSCGVSGADGVVTTSPSPDGDNTYQWISTNGGEVGAGVIDSVGNGAIGNSATGSSYTTNAFTANGGDLLEFYFNYVTTDGAGFADYAWAQLVDSSMTHVAWLFTGRTTTSGDTSPGNGLPANDSTLTPGTSPIIGGGPLFSPLGDDTGSCYNSGCGYTGWIKSEFTIASAGTYYLVFGVTNWNDSGYASALAFDGATIAGESIDPPSQVPVPAALPLLATAIGGIGLMARRRKAV